MSLLIYHGCNCHQLPSGAAAFFRFYFLGVFLFYFFVCFKRDNDKKPASKGMVRAVIYFNGKTLQKY